MTEMTKHGEQKLLSKLARAIASQRGFDPDAYYPLDLHTQAFFQATQTGEQMFWGEACAALAAWRVLSREPISCRPCIHDLEIVYPSDPNAPTTSRCRRCGATNINTHG